MFFRADVFTLKMSLCFESTVTSPYITLNWEKGEVVV